MLNELLNEMSEQGDITSSRKQDDRLNKMFARSGDEGLNLAYEWVKGNTISLKEFKELIKWYTKE